eukprot:CAMPEP_0167781098 /NCGR_PEP_ID=MMETSP0111_2-20121227/5737_1 /TAXON_ID=91324 /ORGANISM="Lotharella globosa, Strain CCCM811" /LENGTH=453 /DNA_ID=CAMNT_0007671709 /DNA_START=33 /DNA_END=1395 /DNA_ORIENTATION=+
MSKRERKHTKCTQQIPIPGCKPEIITPETRKIFLKGLLVWGLFSLGTHIVSQDLIVILLHCVGFGFFLMITTRKTRWLGAVAVGALALVIATYQLIPPEWLNFSYNVIGYMTLLGVFIIGIACTTVQKRESILRSEFLISSMRSVGAYFTKPFSKVDGEQVEASAYSILMKMDKSKLCKVLVDMDARLVETEETMKQNATEHGKLMAEKEKLKSLVDQEVARRLSTERQLAEREEKVMVLKQHLESAQSENFRMKSSHRRRTQAMLSELKTLNHDSKMIEKLQRREKAQNHHIAFLKRALSNAKKANERAAASENKMKSDPKPEPKAASCCPEPSNKSTPLSPPLPSSRLMDLHETGDDLPQPESPAIFKRLGLPTKNEVKDLSAAELREAVDMVEALSLTSDKNMWSTSNSRAKGYGKKSTEWYAACVWRPTSKQYANLAVIFARVQNVHKI